MTVRTERAKRELALVQAGPLAAARASMRGFVEFTMPDYKFGWFNLDICRRLDAFLAAVARRESPRLMLFAPPRHGKLIADDTPIKAATCWTTHGCLKAGDYVFAPDGKPVSIIAVSESGKADTRVELTNGEVLWCHENHEWTVYDRSDGKRDWFTYETSYFMRDTKFGKPVDLFASGRATYLLPLTSAIDTPDAKLAIAPYALGAWLGDGTSTKPCITHAKEDSAVIDGMVACGYAVSSVCVHPTTGVLTTYFSGPRPNVRSVFSNALHETGLLGNKHIPLAYKNASIRQRLDLIAGLVDTDGHVDKRTSRARIVTVSKTLADDVADIVRSLGWHASIHEQEPTLSTSGIQGRRTTYSVGFQPDLHIPTRLERKRITRFAPKRRVGIKSVTRDDRGHVGKCIEVDSDDGLYLVGRTMVATHNSELVSRKFPAYALGRYPDLAIMATSYGSDLSSRVNRDVQRAIDDPAYAKLFPETTLSGSNHRLSSAGTWARNNDLFEVVGHRGSYRSAGVGGGITGMGGEILIVDDPVKDAEQAGSEVYREKVWDWYRSTFYTRRAPGAGIVIILTRWHSDDLAGRLLAAMQNAGEQWEVASFCAIAEDDEPYRKAGEPLHADRYDLEALEATRTALGPYAWESLYQQRPVPREGGAFQRRWFQRVPAAPATVQMRVRSWDLASTLKGGDWTTGVLMSRQREGLFFVENVVRFQGDWRTVKEAIISTARDVDGRGVPIRIPEDPGQAGKFQAGDIVSALEGWDITAEREAGLGSKEVRANPLAAQCAVGNVKLVEGPWIEPFLAELETFPRGKYDDQVDAAAGAFRRLINDRPVTVSAELLSRIQSMRMPRR